jgi:hypothetical protein
LFASWRLACLQIRGEMAESLRSRLAVATPGADPRRTGHFAIYGLRLRHAPRASVQACKLPIHGKVVKFRPTSNRVIHSERG